MELLGTDLVNWCLQGTRRSRMAGNGDEAQHHADGAAKRVLTAAIL
jgi:hypothetical protein